MPRKIHLVLAALVATLVIAVPAMAANTQAVTAACGLNGTGNGLAITLDGSANQTYVVSQHPVDEKTFNVDFRLNLNTLDIPNDTFFVITRGIQTGVGARQNFRLQIRRRASGVYAMFLLAWDTRASESRIRFVQGTPIANPTADDKWRFEFIASTFPGAFNGTLRLLQNDVVRIEKTNWPNNGEIDQIQFGFPSSGVLIPTGGSTPLATGTYCLDEYVSTR